VITPTADAALQTLIDKICSERPLFQIATVYGLRKEPDKMFEWLERAYYGTHDPRFDAIVRARPFLLNYRDDPPLRCASARN